MLLYRQTFAGSAAPIIKDSRETKLFLQDAGLIGNPEPPALSDKGWKDTVIVKPGEVVRLIATFDKPGYTDAPREILITVNC